MKEKTFKPYVLNDLCLLHAVVLAIAGPALGLSRRTVMYELLAVHIALLVIGWVLLYRLDLKGLGFNLFAILVVTPLGLLMDGIYVGAALFAAGRLMNYGSATEMCLYGGILCSFVVIKLVSMFRARCYAAVVDRELDRIE